MGCLLQVHDDGFFVEYPPTVNKKIIKSVWGLIFFYDDDDDDDD